MFLEYQNHKDFLQHRKIYYLKHFRWSFLIEKKQWRKRFAAIHLNNLHFDQQKQLEQFKNSENLFIDWFSNGSQLFELTQVLCFKQLSINVERLVGQVDFQNLSKFLNYFPNLEIFELKIPCQYKIGEQEAFYLGEGLKTLKNLQVLSLWAAANQGAAELLGDSLLQLKELQCIKIKLANFQNIGGLGIQRICQGIQASKQQLKIFSFDIGYYNEVGQLGAQSIAKCISQLNLLECLNLNIKKNNGLDVTGFSDIFESIQSRKFLKCLVLTQTAYVNTEIPKLQNEMESKNSLQQQLFLNLDMQKLNMISMSKSLNQFINLQELTLKLNYESYSQEVIIQIGESLQNIKNIKVFILRSKNLQNIHIAIKLLKSYVKNLSQIVFFHLDFKLPESYYLPLRRNTNTFFKSKRLVKINLT